MRPGFARKLAMWLKITSFIIGTIIVIFTVCWVILSPVSQLPIDIPPKRKNEISNPSQKNLEIIPQAKILENFPEIVQPIPTTTPEQ